MCLIKLDFQKVLMIRALVSKHYLMTRLLINMGIAFILALVALNSNIQTKIYKVQF